MQPAVYVIFTLLSALRRGVERKNIWREFRRQKIALQPRLSFWIALCRQAGLLSRDERLLVTRQARAWLNKSPEEQAVDLIEAWENAPRNHATRRFRKKLLWKLKYDQPLTQKDLAAVRGLEALGLYDEGGLTAWGRIFVKNEGALPTPRPVEPCHLEDDHFIAALPLYADLLWALEKYLRPITPGIYPLTRRAVHFLGGDPGEIIELLERGLQKALPGEIKARLLDQPSICVSEGLVLEFSHPSELQRLRRQPNLRQHIERFLSPRHVLVSTRDAQALFKILQRHGVHVFNNEEIEPQMKRTHFSQSPTRPAVYQICTPLGRSACDCDAERDGYK